MNCCSWKVTYTKQKVKKTKLYHDGILTVKLFSSSQRKAVLYTEDGAYLDEMFLGQNDEVNDGKILEFPFFLVDISGSLPNNGDLPSSKKVSQILACLRRPQHGGCGYFDARERTRTAMSQIERKVSISTSNNEQMRRPGDQDSSVSALRSLQNCNLSSPRIKRSLSRQLQDQENRESDSWQKADSAYHRPQILQKKLIGLENSSPTSNATTGLAPLQQSSIVFQADLPPPRTRKIVIPHEFSSISAYQVSMSLALIEELNLIVADFAHLYSTSRKKLFALSRRKPTCKHGLAKLQVTKKEGHNFGRMFFICPLYSSKCLFLWADSEPADSVATLSMEELAKGLSANNIDFYWNCDLFIRRRTSTPTLIDHVGKDKKETSSYEASLKLAKWGKTSTLSKGDLWIISSNCSFKKEKGQDFLLIAVSVSHGTFSNGVVQLQILGNTKALTDCRKVYALHGPRISSELAMLENIRTLDLVCMPILQLLLSFPKSYPHQLLLDIETSDLVKETTMKYRLNEDQAVVMIPSFVLFMDLLGQGKAICW